MKTDDPWIRVKDEGELREGMVIKETPCSHCANVHVGILLRREPEPSMCVYCGKPCCGWFCICPCAVAGVPFCLNGEARRGHLYRLAPSQLADLSESTTAPRELERAR